VKAAAPAARKKGTSKAAKAAPIPTERLSPVRLAVGSSGGPSAVPTYVLKDDGVKSSGSANNGKAAAAAAAAKPAEKSAAKPTANRSGFKQNEFIVYPAHGVGQIIAIEEQEVAGFKLELFVINFFKDKMTLKVPLPKVLAGAIRKLADAEIVQKALDTLTGRARIKRTMWSRRAQEYEAKINSGDLQSIAEVVRDLYRSDAQPEQSYSERQLYEAALDRMAREIAAVQKLTEMESLKLIESQLQKGPRRGGKVDVEVDAAEGDVDAEEGEADGDVEEAA
jgi:CarD family transcriptional regulator